MFTPFVCIYNKFQKIELFKTDKVPIIKSKCLNIWKRGKLYIRKFIFEEVISEYIYNKSVEISNGSRIKGKSIYYVIINSCYQ